jgi:hypothetical protein
MILVGIDPGTKGAIAVYRSNSKTIEVSRIYNKDGTYRESFLDIAKKLPANGATKVFLEKVNGIPKWGFKNFAFGKVYGEMLGILVIRDIPYELVAAVTWQKAVYDSGCKKAKPGSRKDMSEKEVKAAERKRYKAKKEANMLLAKRLFPRFSYLLDVKDNDGIADALLIMLYGIRREGLNDPSTVDVVGENPVFG